MLTETEDYFDAQDLVGRWIEERCWTDTRRQDTMNALFRSWEHWMHGQGEPAGSERELHNALRKRGYKPVRHVKGQRGKRGFLGIEARLEDTPPHWSETGHDE
ncbi:hypothetical protein [Cupriavidus sp. AcVe19-6a]|uniref:hypothetical protein n=1 Tax=Cupriavidus sp. AcVe19-6a TaxID=2821358 RepID=UPI001AE36D6A|nr:hypothetical protein [Cupriavidus sp. AcVe19-6a]MBP0639572.1 hypothetical protein [Cupriavidus sp. AcVe19-6a]